MKLKINMTRIFSIRHTVYICLFFVFGLLLLLIPVNAADAPREIYSLDAGWKFHRGDIPGALFSQPIAAWRWKADDRGESSASEMAAPDLATGDGWQDAQPGDNTFKGRGGSSWYRAVIKGRALDRVVFHFDSIFGNTSAAVYLNGKKIGQHDWSAKPFEVAAETAWKTSGDNVLAVVIGNTKDSGGGIGPVVVDGIENPPQLSLTHPANPSYDDRSWRQVDVPHDYVIEGTFNEKTGDKDHGFLPTEPAWYRKAITIPATAAGRRIWLEFDGVFSNSSYWLNGRLIGHERSGYSSFRFDITDAAKPGQRNVLTVRTDPVFEGWWYEGGGIYRHTRMVILDPVHVAPWGVYADARVADPSDGVHADATVVVKTALANDVARPVEAAVLSEVLDSEGRVVGKAQGVQRLAANSVADAPEQQIALAKASLWSLDTPVLYRLRTTVSVAGKVVDRHTVNFGVRQLRFDPDHGFFLNGKSVKLKGVCCHQDHAGVGIAIPDRLQVWRLERLKEMGCNAYRTSHNAATPELLDACDRLGILVMDETRHFGDTYCGKTPFGTTATKLVDLTGQVQRDRNHPSVIMWSVGNEEPLSGSPVGAEIAKAMKTRIDRFDGSRPVTMGMNFAWGEKGSVTYSIDLQGFNYYPEKYKWFHELRPLQPIVGTETASQVITRGIYSEDKVKGYVPAYGTICEKYWQPQDEMEFVMGGFAWTGFDYKGEPTPYEWPCVNSHYGIMDICGFPKDNYYYYQSWWTDKPVMHIFPHWNWQGKEGQEIAVWVYSNCDEVELFLNGTSLGKQTMPKNQHLEWKVKYTPGELTAKGTYHGKAVTDTVETTGEPAGIVLEPDRTHLNSDGSDLTVVAVKIVDAKGRVVPTAGNLVHFNVSGSGVLLGVGNGDPSCHEPDKASQRSAFNGLAQVLVQTTRKPGIITLKAESDRLKMATITLNAPETQKNTEPGKL
jgi:beta-galactosidase